MLYQLYGFTVCDDRVIMNWGREIVAYFKESSHLPVGKLRKCQDSPVVGVRYEPGIS